MGKRSSPRFPEDGHRQLADGHTLNALLPRTKRVLKPPAHISENTAGFESPALWKHKGAEWQ